MSQQTSHGPFFLLMDNSALKQNFLHSYHQIFLPYLIIFLWLLTTTKILPLRCKSAWSANLGPCCTVTMKMLTPLTLNWELKFGSWTPYCSLSIGITLLSYFNPGRSTMWSVKLYHTVLSKLFYLYKLSGVSTELKKMFICKGITQLLHICRENLHFSPLFISVSLPFTQGII